MTQLQLTRRGLPPYNLTTLVKDTKTTWGCFTKLGYNTISTFKSIIYFSFYTLDSRRSRRVGVT